MKTALITGIGGQDGPYLAKLLLDKGYSVYGLNKQRGSLDNLDKLGIRNKVQVWEGDITDPSCVNLVLKAYRPDEIYNLAAQSHVGHSFVTPQLTCNVNYMGYLNVLLGARSIIPNARIYQAGTSEMFGYSASILQNEETPLQPKSPYAVAKVAAHWAGVNARYEADQFVSNGILFNHESPLRHSSFVTKKITNKVSAIVKGDKEPLRLGNIDSKRDWGYAPDYVEAMWLMLQHERPDDFVIATGKAHTVREFVSEAFRQCGKVIEFFGTGQSETGWVDGKLVMEIDPQFYRPNELGYLCGDATKAKEVLCWVPKVGFEQLVSKMVTE
jgi:GDPmannose 4,6-dehydratase